MRGPLELLRSIAMRVVVTGGLGFLGRAGAAALVEAGHSVLVVDAGSGEPPAGAEFARADVTDAPAIARAFARFRPETVIHLASLLTPASQADAVAATRVNVLGTAVVFAAAREAAATRIVYASSVSALGPDDGAVGDGARPAPQTVYGATKACAEHLAAGLAAQGGAAFLGLRFGWVYGSGRDRGWREVQEVIEAVARGERRVRYPDFPEPLDWTWIGDAAEVIARAASARVAGHRVLNVAGDKRRVREAAAHLARRFPDVVLEPFAATSPAAWSFRNDGLKAALGYEPATRMEDGIDRLLAARARTSS